MQVSVDQTPHRRWALPILTGQGAFAIMGWKMASPTIVLSFLAVSLDLPIFLAGSLVAILHAAGTVSDIFLAGPISRKQNKRSAMALADIATAICFAFAIAVAFFGTKSIITLSFIIAIFAIGIIREIKTLMITDFLSDNLRSDARMRIHYTQMALGGAGAIALTWLAHIVMLEYEPLARHSTVIAIAIGCFFMSAIAMLALTGLEASTVSPPTAGQSKSTLSRNFLPDLRQMFSHRWFQKYMIVRLSLVIVGLSVPFFALIAAESHHTSAKGLTVLIISAAAGTMVAAPLWGILNGLSNRVVIVTGTMLVAMVGSLLIAIYFSGIEHGIHLHAISLFVATIAVSGISSARSLYYMDIAPKAQRVVAQAVSKSVGRISIIAFSAVLAAIAHTQEVIWAIVAIVVASLAAAIVSYRYVAPKHESAAT